MNVSRETTLPKVLDRFCRSLNFTEDTLYDNISFTGLTRPALGLFILSLYKSVNKTLFLIYDENQTAERLYTDCLNLSPKYVCFFPDSSPNQIDIEGFNLENERYRSEVVNLLRSSKSGIVFTSKDAAKALTIDHEKNVEAGIQIKTGLKIGYQKLVNKLMQWGYEATDHTETPKTFSTRGGILDVFLLYSAHPIRIEFFGDEVESIRIFNPSSQRTIKNIDFVEILPPPIVSGAENNKISLLDLFGDHPVHVSEQDGLYNVLIGQGEKTVDLNCKNISFDGTIGNSDQITLEEAYSGVGNGNTFIFSGNREPKEVEIHNIEKHYTVKLPLSTCFYSSYVGIFSLSLSELNHQTPVFNSRWTIEDISDIPQKDFSSLDTLSWGDYLVHQDFGVGLYRGLERIKTHDGVEQEFIKIEYADHANIYVPVEKFNRVHKMIKTGNNEPTMSTLNSPKWGKQKQTAKNSAKEVAHDLIKLYTSRNRERGFKYDSNNNFMRELQLSFPYDETPGQITAIGDVISDMESLHSVDRLICGDVGFGKTEVALRAALKSIISGKKVLFLTPTTILADQHYISTKARLDPLGVKVELLSRFKTKKQQREILEKMLTGSTDLVIGTHRLLSQDVNFPDLGLLIVDEEHRFGVRHKEKLRQLRTTVDVITLTATPIPRTLQQSLLGIRDISHINTPPKTRRPIKTFVQYIDWNNIKNIIAVELSRGGQVYFLHNNIASIPFILKKLINLFPDCTIGVAHGKLDTRKLERTVLAFFDGKINILLCTTIIESGLDVANANTIIINNAQNFGLSQLYQIRGRVGRSYQQAYCYLLLPKGKTIGADARKRLKAIEQYTSLGSGYEISMKDLEIRGAGNLFGYKQSGHIAKVGFEMYCKLLQEAVDETIGNTAKKQPPKISVSINALLEDSYIELVQDRLYFYQQLSEATSIDKIDNIEEELKDRFGRLPEAAQNLLKISKLRIKLTGTAIDSVSVIGSELKIYLSDYSPYKSIDVLITNVSSKLELNNLVYHFAPKKDVLAITVSTDSIDKAIKSIDLFVELFSNGNFS